MTNFQQSLLQTSERIAVIEPSKALELLGGEGVCFVDLRDGYEIEQYGRIPGSRHCPRGSLEFRIPHDSEYHSPFFSQSERFVFYCSHGQRSILAVDTAQRFGLHNVCHIKGGMIAWVQAGGAIEKAEKRLGVRHE